MPGSSGKQRLGRNARGGTHDVASCCAAAVADERAMHAIRCGAKATRPAALHNNNSTSSGGIESIDRLTNKERSLG